MKLKQFIAMAALTLSMPASADEGMWTLYNLPTQVYDQMCGYGFSCLTAVCTKATRP